MVIEGFESRSGELDRGLLVLTFREPLLPGHEAQLRAALQRAGITREEEAEQDDETATLVATCFVPLVWEPPPANDRARQEAALAQIAERFHVERLHCLRVATALRAPDDEEDEDEQEEDEDEDGEDEGGWRAGPPAAIEDTSFPLQGREQRLESFDWEDFGIAVKLAGPERGGEERLVRALHEFWLAPYRDPENDDWEAYRHADVAYDAEHRSALLWVDRFFVPASPEELVGHLAWIAEKLHAMTPIAHARFDGATTDVKYAALTGRAAPPFVLAGNPMREPFDDGGEDVARAWATTEARGTWGPRELGAMALELVYEVDPDDDPDEALRRIDFGLSFDEKSVDLAQCRLEVLLRHARVDEALATLERRDDVAVHLAQLGPLLRRDRLEDLARVVKATRRIDANERALAERLPRVADVAPGHLGAVLSKLAPDEDLVPGLHAAAHALAQREDEAAKDAAFAVFEAIFARELPSPDSAARQNYVSAFNNACIVAHAAKRYALAASIADRAQPFVSENPFIAHSAACAYAAAGEIDKALGQVKLAIELDYEHLAKLEKDSDLGPLLESREFKALFEKWRAEKAKNRPAGVPEGATWDESDKEWVLAERDAEGREHGLVRYFRPDGSLCCETEFDHGVPHGAFRRFHESGEPSRSGAFSRGKLQGTNVFYRSGAATTEKFPDGLGDHVWRAELDYDGDRIVAGRLFDREGSRIREDGSPMPERPAGVAEDAHFGTVADEDRWISGQTSGDGARIGTWRFWDGDGTLLHEVGYQGGKRHGLERTFDPETGVARVRNFEHDRLTGEIAEHYPPGSMRDARIRVGRGPADEDGKHGVWSFFDANGAFVVSVDLGVPSATEAFAAAGADAARHASEWRSAADALCNDRHYAAALCAMARATGAGGPALDFARMLSGHCIPLGEAERARRAALAQSLFEEEGAALGRDGLLALVGRALLDGGDPASLLRLAARAFDDVFATPVVAADFIAAALAVAPERRDLEQTRALIELSSGRPERADAAVARLRDAEPELARMLATYRAFLYPKFDFWPTGDPAARWAVEHAGHEGGGAPVRDAATMRAVVQESASRLMLLRSALEAQVGDVPWLLPKLDALLPDGPVAVRKAVVDAVFVDDPPSKIPTAVRDDVADTFGFDARGRASVLTLVRRARVEWATLGWLCFLAGLDAIALPSRERPRPAGGLRDAFMSRHDLLVDRANGDDAEIQDELGERLAGGDWYGQSVRELDRPNAEFALKEHKALLGVAAWAVDEGRFSPWHATDD